MKASLVKGGRFQVGDRRFDVPPAVVSDDRERTRWFSALVMDVAGDRLSANAERMLTPVFGGAMTLRRQERVLVVERDGRAVAVLAGRSAMAVGKQVIRGNFLSLQGGHWNTFVTSLREPIPPPDRSQGSVAAIVTYLTALGVETRAEGSSAIRLNDVVVDIPAAVLEGGKGVRRSWIDALATTHLQAALRARAERELPLGLLGLELEPGPEGIVVRRGATHLAAISGSRARLEGETIKGRFLARGPHWTMLAARLRRGPSEPGAALRAIARRELPWSRLAIEIHAEPLHLDLRRRGSTVAIVTATRATLVSGGRIDGDYRVSGRHWQQLAEGLKARKAAVPVRVLPRAPAVQSQPSFVLSELPEGVADAVRDAAFAASHRLREDRSLVFEHTVLLEMDDARIRLLPLTRPPARLAVPFSVSRGAKSIEGRLRLRSPADPLECQFSGGTDRADAVDAWVLALLAYADLTCVAHPELTSAPSPRAQARPRVGGPRTADHDRARTTHGPRAFLPTASFVPVGRTAQIMASYVAAHRRRLRPPSTASSRAQAAARVVGISLRPHETWVSGHFRGVPPDGELQFRWTAPAKARGLLR